MIMLKNIPLEGTNSLKLKKFQQLIIVKEDPVGITYRKVLKNYRQTNTLEIYEVISTMITTLKNKTLHNRHSYVKHH
jgi:hypothetical protein